MQDLKTIIDLVEDFYVKHTSINYERFDSNVLISIFTALMIYYSYIPEKAYYIVNDGISSNIRYFDEAGINVFQAFDALELTKEFYFKHTSPENEGIDPYLFASASSIIMQFFAIFKDKAKDILRGIIADYLNFVDSNPTIMEVIDYLRDFDRLEYQTKIDADSAKIR